MIYTSCIGYLPLGLLLGLLYYQHIWLEVCALKGGNPPILLRFWFRFSLLALCLALLFYFLPQAVPFMATGIVLSKPIYIYMRKKSIFEVLDGR
ncbi:MAG: hypothetical protein D6710_10065 [Nitrospirae bacterium]|nr:MAG: hypothetical protein D6710_10065 [Nitrospirota bacterium]